MQKWSRITFEIQENNYIESWAGGFWRQVVLTIEIEAYRGIALSQFVFGSDLIFSGIFYSHIEDLQCGRVQISVFFTRRTLQIHGFQVLQADSFSTPGFISHKVWVDNVGQKETHLMPRTFLNLLRVVRPRDGWSGFSFDLTLKNELFAVVLLADRRFFSESRGSAIDLSKNRIAVL